MKNQRLKQKKVDGKYSTANSFKKEKNFLFVYLNKKLFLAPVVNEQQKQQKKKKGEKMIQHFNCQTKNCKTRKKGTKRKSIF